MRERFYERKEKTHIPRRDKGPLGLQRRDELDGLQEEEKRRTGWWVASPCQHSWWPWPLCFWLQTLRRPLLVLTLLWHLLAISSSLFWGGIPMFYVGIRQQHFSTFMYLGWDSTPCLKWRMSSELSKECTKLPPYCAGFKEELTNPSTCAGTTGEKNVFSLFCWKLTRGNLELGLYTHYQHDDWTHPQRGPAWERSGGKGKRRSPRCLKAAHLWPQWFLVLKDLLWL